MSRRLLVLAIVAMSLVIFTIAIIAYGRGGPVVPMVLVPPAESIEASPPELP